MPTRSLFPTLVYTAALPAPTARTLNRQLLRECGQLELDDDAGRRWSTRNYPGGYTSYASAHRMHEASPTFARLQKLIDRHVQRYARELQFDLEARQLTMTDCWVNRMAKGVAHGLHLHPLATISGTYYVQTPRGAPGLKVEDPRLDKFMAAPPRRRDAPEAQRHWVVLPAAPGTLTLFESWLRHEVAPNPVQMPRLSISFNYGWF